MASRLSDKVEGICRNIEANENSWSVRLNELVTLQKLISSTKRNPHVWTIQILQRLSKPLASQIQDLRSSIVREACKTIQIFSKCLEDTFRPLAKTVLPILMEVLGCGNKVISSYVNDCCTTLIENTHVKSAFSLMSELVRTSRSKLLRERSIEYMIVMLETWPFQDMQRHDHHVASALKTGLADASSETRAAARKCFHAFAEHFPERADSLVRYVDSRTQRLLLEENQQYLVKRRGGGDSSPESSPSRSKTPSKRSHDTERKRIGARLNVKVPSEESTTRSPKYSPIRASTASISSLDSSSSAGIGTKGFKVSIAEPVLVSTRFGDCIGQVRYCGRPVEFADGEWIGVEFDEPVGKNDGSVQGIQYFRCRANHGLFVRPSQMRPYFKRSPSKAAAPTPSFASSVAVNAATMSQYSKSFDSKRGGIDIDGSLHRSDRAAAATTTANGYARVVASSSSRTRDSLESGNVETRPPSAPVNSRTSSYRSRYSGYDEEPRRRENRENLTRSNGRSHVDTAVPPVVPSTTFSRTSRASPSSFVRDTTATTATSSPYYRKESRERVSKVPVNYLDLGQDMLETHRAHIDDILEALKVEMEELAKFEDRLTQCREKNRRLAGTVFHSYISAISRRLGKRQTHHVILSQKLEDCQALLAEKYP
eukprot:g1449.t1